MCGVLLTVKSSYFVDPQSQQCNFKVEVLGAESWQKGQSVCGVVGVLYVSEMGL